MNITHFFVAGINYKKSEASVRGLFAINPEQYDNILKKAPLFGLSELFILSTCNRTEVYGFANSADDLLNLICLETAGTAETFKTAAYIKSGMKAVKHMFEVAAGLDSQILGDYEIVGQLKTAAKFAKERGFVGSFTERLINSVLQASKQVKNHTELSGGTVSVSFAAVQYIRNHVPDVAGKHILLLGVGKIGRNTCRNLVDYLQTTNITLVNRSTEKAATLASELGLRWASTDNIEAEIAGADIILAATNATEPVILTEYLRNKGPKLIIDLSIPYNVEASATCLENVRLVNVDQLSRLKDATLKKREAEVPKAKAIIAELMAEFSDWCEMRKHAPMLKNLKLKLKELYTHPLYVQQPEHFESLDLRIQKVINETAGKVRIENQRGCQYIAALNDFISAEAS